MKGFSSILGNPPFLGGKKIKTFHSDSFRNFIVSEIANSVKGNADLSVYFLLLSCDLSSEDGIVSLITTNSIAEGDSRAVGLDKLVKSDYSIISALRDKPWSGDASVVVHAISLSKKSKKISFLDGKEVSNINSYLRNGREISPQVIESRKSKANIGVFLGTSEFVLQGDWIGRISKAHPKNVKPILNGSEINSLITDRGERVVLDLEELNEEDILKSQILTEFFSHFVKPLRLNLPESRKRAKQLWWKFESPAVVVRRIMSQNRHLIVLPEASKLGLPSIVKSESIVSHAVVLFESDSFEVFAILSSCFHWWWTQYFAPRLKGDTRYNCENVYATFPLIEKNDIELTELGKNLYFKQLEGKNQHQVGLTSLYSMVDDNNCDSELIKLLREIHTAIDMRINYLYGLDVELDHDFQETKQGRKYTISSDTAEIVVDKMLQINDNIIGGIR